MIQMHYSTCHPAAASKLTWGGRCSEETRNSNRFQSSWNTSEAPMDLPKWRWRSASHPGHDRSKCSVVSSPPLCHNVDN